MTRYKLFYCLFVVGTITVFGCGNKSPTRSPKAEKSKGPAVKLVAKSMSQDSAKDDTKTIHPEPATAKPIKLKLLVKEGHRDGQLVQNASAELFYTSSDGLTEEKLASGKTDSAGRVTLDVSWYLANTGSGSYHVAITSGSKTKRAKLERFPEVKHYTLYAPVRPPEKLMRVTLECEKGWEIEVIPFLSGGVDIVNGGGKGHNAESGGRRLSVEYLPSAVIATTIGQTGSGDAKKSASIPLPLQSSDNGKTLRLRANGPCVYMNNDLVFVNFQEINNPGTWVRNSAPKNPDGLFGEIEKLLKIDHRKTTLRHVSIGTYDKYLPVLQWLKGSGVGVVIADDTEKIEKGDSTTTKVIPFSKKYARSLVDARPKCLFYGMSGDGRREAIPFSDLTSLENLLVFNDFPEDTGHRISLASLSKLHHLMLLGSDVSSTELSKLANLRSLRFTLCSSFDPKVLAEMPQLRFLTVLPLKKDGTKTTRNLEEIYIRLPRLQNLSATFPVSTDFSFTERMPYLQTLGVLNMTAGHNLSPLEKHPRLKCLALDGDVSFEKIVAFNNVKKFERARPDVPVVKAKGVCLGSFWLLPLAAIVGIIAWLIRRRRCYGVRHG